QHLLHHYTRCFPSPPDYISSSAIFAGSSQHPVCHYLFSGTTSRLTCHLLLFPTKPKAPSLLSEENLRVSSTCTATGTVVPSQPIEISRGLWPDHLLNVQQAQQLRDLPRHFELCVQVYHLDLHLLLHNLQYC
ncbi:unnamed protein product, partial [Amoebophrya sp. A25]